MSTRTAAPRFRRPSGTGRALSRRRVKQTVALGQWWRDLGSGECWQLRQIHRHDGIVEIQRPGGGRRLVTFLELGRRFELLDEDAEG